MQRRQDREHDRADSRAESLAGALQVLQGTAGRQALSGAAGVHGALADLVEVDPGFEVAFEAALCGALESVVVDGSHAADAVALLRSRSVSGTLLPAVPIAAGPDASLTQLPILPRGADALRSHVRTAVPEVQVLLDRLLAGTAVVPGGWEAALEIALDRPELTLLTTEGDRFSRDGWTIGVASRGLTPAVVEEARAAALVAARAAGAAVAAVETARDEVAAAARNLADTQKALAEAVERRIAIERSMEQASAVAKAIEHEMAEADPERAALEARMLAAHQQLDELRRELADLTETAETATTRAAEAERARMAHSARRADVQGRRNQVQVRAGALDERRQVLGARLEDVEKRLSGHAEERRLAEERRRRIVADSVAVERLQKVVEAHLGRVESVAGQLQELRDRQVEMLRAGGARLEDLRRQRVATDERLARVRDRHQKFDVEIAEVGARHQAATEALERELDCRPDEAIAAECPELPEGRLPEQRAAELHAELQKMGPINPLAAEELSALEERNEFLEREVDDVRRARRELQQVIRAVDDEIARLFAEAFADVDRHFQVLVECDVPWGCGEALSHRADRCPRHGRRARGSSCRKAGAQTLAALGRRTLPRRTCVPVRRVPQPTFTVLRDGRGRGGARRREPPPLPRSAARVPRRGAADRREPPKTDDGVCRRPLRSDDDPRRLFEGREPEGERPQECRPGDGRATCLLVQARDRRRPGRGRDRRRPTGSLARQCSQSGSSSPSSASSCCSGGRSSWSAVVVRRLLL